MRLPTALAALAASTAALDVTLNNTILDATTLGATTAINSSTTLGASPPVATIANGTITGSSSNNIDSFRGVPFASPPIGSLRLRPPQPATSFDHLDETQDAPSCIPVLANLNGSSLPSNLLATLLNSPLLHTVQHVSDDCLPLNIDRPAGTTPSSALPVVVWIYGGGFEAGFARTYSGSTTINRGLALNAPFIFVALNYRLSGFGFLPGAQLAADGATNLGLRDQRLALEWIAENIAAFGDDPARVILWGESAGAISVYDHLLIDNGDHTYRGKPLFAGAVMNSSTAVPTRNVDKPKAQRVFDEVVRAAGCTGPDPLPCLRGLSTEAYTTALAAVPSILSYQSLNLAYLPRADPSSSFLPVSPNAATSVAPVPLIAGDQEDEGTLFAIFAPNVTTPADVSSYFQGWFPDTDPALVQALVDAFPDDPRAGSPFRTGELNELHPQFKRVAAIMGDFVFTLARRVVLERLADGQPCWSYLNRYLHGVPFLGTFHGEDQITLFNALSTSPTAPSQPIDYYISFFTHGDPNTLLTTNPPNNTSTDADAKTQLWPRWTNATRQLLQFDALNTAVATDDFRQDTADKLRGLMGRLLIKNLECWIDS